MKIGPKFKIARRLGAPVFEKTQSSKFVLSDPRKAGKSSRRGGGQKSDFGLQMLEKQKARFYYLISEKQFANYVKAALAKKDSKAVPTLYEMLETRLDNVVLRLGLAHTRPLARQLVSHGHIIVNGKKVTIPSYRVKMGDIVAIRKGSQKALVFATLDERMLAITVPSWIRLDPAKKEGTIQGVPKMETVNLLFDLNSVFEFYSR